MIPHDFIKKWQGTKLKERAAAQEHFLDLCRLLGEPSPAETDPTGRDYGFEVGATKTTGGRGFADVFKRGCFGWEYKGTHANLDTAFAQLQRYAVALDNPPLLIVSDIGTMIRIHTNWTNSVSKTYEIPIAELEDAAQRDLLKLAFKDPEALRPAKSKQELTEEVAGEFAVLATLLREKGHPPEQVAHFINRLVFCMFAEDVKLLPSKMFTRMIEQALEDPSEFEEFARSLFLAMQNGGRVGFEKVAWFNGGLFNDELVFSLTKEELKIVHRAAVRYWGDIDPSILGTLFERGLDPEKRAQLGAHYTDREKIMMIVGPTIIEPLAAEWSELKGVIKGHMERSEKAKGGTRTKARNQAQAALNAFLKRLADYRVLDPACGSGNFLYVALRELKNLEHLVQVEAEGLGLPRGFPQIGPEVVRGIEINPYAAELARVSVWIGEIQWMLKNGFSASANPILKPLDTIECRDALLARDPDGEWIEAEWPEADGIIGNPPFLGDRLMKGELGADYVDKLRAEFKGRVPGGADFVLFWVSKALGAIEAGRADRVGFVTTNSVRSGANRKVLDKVSEGPGFFAAWDDEPWTVDGAAVRVSLIMYGNQKSGESPKLDNIPVARINPDLTGSAVDLTQAKELRSNIDTAFQGVIPRSTINRKDAEKLGLPDADFAIDGASAREMLLAPTNPNGQRNCVVVVPYLIGRDITQRSSDRFIVDFGTLSESEASLYEIPFEYIKPVRAHRAEMSQPEALETWWQHWRSRQELRSATRLLPRFVVTPRVSKYRVFSWASSPTLPDNAVVAIAKDDDTSFGILHSRCHELWSLRLGSWLGKGNDPRYTPTTCFETFPFPEGLTPDIPAADYAEDSHAIAIGTAASRLNELRENWLNPPDLVRREPEVVEGFPERIFPVDDMAVEILKTRTLTNLYNLRPAWLVHAHQALDEAVASAYGWPVDLSDDEILARLFALNQEQGK